MSKYHRSLALHLLTIIIFSSFNLHCGDKRYYRGTHRRQKRKKRAHVLYRNTRSIKNKERSRYTRLIEKRQKLRINTKNRKKHRGLSKTRRIRHNILAKKQYSRKRVNFERKNKALDYNQILKFPFMLGLKTLKNPLMTAAIVFFTLVRLSSQAPVSSCSCSGVSACSNHTLLGEFGKEGSCADKQEKTFLCCNPTTRCCCEFDNDNKKAAVCYPTSEQDSGQGSIKSTVSSLFNWVFSCATIVISNTNVNVPVNGNLVIDVKQGDK